MYTQYRMARVLVVQIFANFASKKERYIVTKIKFGCMKTQFWHHNKTLAPSRGRANPRQKYHESKAAPYLSDAAVGSLATLIQVVRCWWATPEYCTIGPLQRFIRTSACSFMQACHSKYVAFRVDCMINIKIGVQSACSRSPHASVAESPPNFPGTWSVYCRVSQDDQCAQISYSRGVRSENSQTTICHFGFTAKVYRSVMESIHTQWQFALAKERTKTLVALVIRGRRSRTIAVNIYVDNDDSHWLRRTEQSLKVFCISSSEQLTSYMSHKQHTQINCTAKWRKMQRHTHIYPSSLTQGALIATQLARLPSLAVCKH